MKFWIKTYFFVLILFLIVFNASIFWVLHATYKSIVDSEIEKAQAENYFIKQTLVDDMLTLDSNNRLTDLTVENLMNYYSDYYSNQNVSFLLSRNEEVIYSNLRYKAEFKDVILKKLAVLEQNDSKYVLITNEFAQAEKKYHLVYCYKLERTMKVWDRIQKVVICFSFAVSLVLAVLLALLLNRRSKPLKQLIDNVDNLKDGDFNSKVEIRGRDEFSLLGNSFNQMSEKIRNNVEQLNSDMKMKQQFIDNLSHELRTPLTSIYGYAEYIQKAAISEEDKYEATKTIMEESKRLQYIANRLLDMTVRRKIDIVKNSIDIGQLFERAVRVVSPVAKEKSINIHIRNELSSIIGEELLIESVLVNLLDNAIKASEIYQSIELVGFRKEDKAIIQVIDTGKGISQEHIKHITEPFYRTDKARSNIEGGAGLGLALCKQIITDMHHGKLDFTSELGKGTTVTVTFTT